MITWLSNPGVIQKENNKNLVDLLNIMGETEPSNICPECYIIKVDRSRHCEFCKSCISHYDHHCPWVNNCVGVKNHKYFLTYFK